MKDKLKKSNNYKGVFYYIKEGKKIYLYIHKYKSVIDGIEKILSKRKIVGSESDGITEKIAFLEKVKSQELLKKEAVIKKEALPTFNEVVTKYFATNNCKSKYKLELTYNKYIKNMGFAKKTITLVARLEILEWRNNMLSDFKLSKGTVNVYLSFLVSIFHFAVNNNLDRGFFFNKPLPTYKVMFKQAKVKRQGWLSHQDIRLLLQTVKSHKDKHLYPFVAIAVYTGARFRTILNIQKKDINLDRLLISIQDTKNQSRYYVGLNEDLYHILYERISLLKNPNDYLFQNDGILINARSFEERLLKILDKLFNQGLDRKDSVHKIVIHSLRHTCASHLASEGASMQVIQKQLNHNSEYQSKVYTKVSPESAILYAMKLNFGE